MMLLILELGERLVALPALQIEEVTTWPPPSGHELLRLELAGALGLVSSAPSCCLLVASDSAAGRVGFGVPAPPRAVESSGEQVSRLPGVLRRLGSPAWLRGFVELERTLALLVDLSQLAAHAQHAQHAQHLAAPSDGSS